MIKIDTHRMQLPTKFLKRYSSAMHQRLQPLHTIQDNSSSWKMKVVWRSEKDISALPTLSNSPIVLLTHSRRCICHCGECSRSCNCRPRPIGESTNCRKNSFRLRVEENVEKWDGNCASEQIFVGCEKLAGVVLALGMKIVLSAAEALHLCGVGLDRRLK